MATSESSVYNSSDLVKDYICGPCESKTFEASADYFCAACMRFFCKKCINLHDQLYANHSNYGREETNKWPLTKAVEDLLLKCDVHKNEKLKMFCQDHSQLCCTDCAFLNHRQCASVTLICDSVEKMPLDMHQLTINLRTILDELNKFKITQESSIQSAEVSYSEQLKEIRDMRKKLNDDLDELENKTLKEFNEKRTTLQTALKKDIDNCSRLKDELKQLSDAINALCDKSNKEIEFIASKKCLDKMQESESYLKKKYVKVQRSIIFKANSEIEKYLSQQASLGRIVNSMQSLTLNPNQVLTVKSKSEFIVRMSSDTSQNCTINGICCLSSCQVIVIDYDNKKVKLLDKHYNVSSHCVVSGNPYDVCQISSSEVAVTVDNHVQFISVINGQLVSGRKFQLTHEAVGIAFHEGALYVTSGSAVYQYAMSGSLVKKLYVDGFYAVWKCAVNPAGDRIYVTNNKHDKLITLATDGTLISTFKDPELKRPCGVHVTPAGQVLVCVQGSNTVIQLDREGKKKLATLISLKDGVRDPLSVCYNTYIDQIIVGLNNNNKINLMELQ